MSFDFAGIPHHVPTQLQLMSLRLEPGMIIWPASNIGRNRSAEDVKLENQYDLGADLGFE